MPVSKPEQPLDVGFPHRPRPLHRPLGPVQIPPLAVLRAQRDAWRLGKPGRGYREEIFTDTARVILIEDGDPVATAESDTEYAALANALQAVL